MLRVLLKHNTLRHFPRKYAKKTDCNQSQFEYGDNVIQPNIVVIICGLSPFKFVS